MVDGGRIVTIDDARYSNGAAAGRFVRTLRLPPVVATDRPRRGPDEP